MEATGLQLHDVRTGCKFELPVVKNSLLCALIRAWYEMEWIGKWNGTEILVWNMEDARMEWNGRFQEWNGRQSSILPY